MVNDVVIISHSENIGDAEYILPQGNKGKHRGRRRLSKPVLSTSTQLSINSVEVSKPKVVCHGPYVHFDKLNVQSRWLPTGPR